MLQESIPYLIATVILIATILAFFAIARGRYAQFGIAQLLIRILVALPLLTSAVLIHFLGRNQCTAMIPPIVPSPIFLVILTGIFEILGAIGLFVKPFRRSAALCIAVLMVAVFPANIFVAGETFFGQQMPSVPVRLAMQVVYIWMVLLAGYGRPVLGKIKAETSPNQFAAR